MKILVAGVNIRHIAASASRAGHVVIAADCYCDRDLSLWAKETFRLPRQGWEECLDHLVQEHQPDALVLGPGLEEAIVQDVPVLNNPPEKTSLVSDKLWLAGWLEREGFPFIRTESSPEKMRYPFLVKPRRGAGGVGCRTVRSPADLQWQDGLIAQELISGPPASVSVIGSGSEAQAIAVNEQLIGLSWAGAKGFRYSGNITPLEPPQRHMAGMAERIVSGLGLVGSNGVDFLLSETGPVPVESTAASRAAWTAWRWPAASMSSRPICSPFPVSSPICRALPFAPQAGSFSMRRRFFGSMPICSIAGRRTCRKWDRE